MWGLRSGESAFHFFFPVLCVCAPFRHASEHCLRAPPLSLGQKPKRPRCRKVLTMTTTTCTTLHASSTHVPPTISTRGRPPSLTHKETTGINLRSQSPCMSSSPLFSFFFSFFLYRMPDGMGRPGSAETRVNVGALFIDLVSSFSVSLFFIFGCIQYL